MMSVREYANDTNHSVAEILKKCNELGINVKSGDDELTEDDIIILDNTINLISTDSETDYEEEDAIDEAVEDLVESNNLDKNFANTNKKQKLKKKSQLQSSKDEYMSKRKEMYKHKEKLMSNAEEENVILYKEGMSVQNLADELGVSGTEIIKKIMTLGLMLSLNNAIDYETASVIALDYNKTLKKEETQDISNFEEFETNDREEDLVVRPPVVTIMGHVDHGKTTLLDTIRKSKIVDSEYGGITQAIGAYQVERNNHKITFIDTPGHAAFTEMRARGASITDIVIIIVAADDGVMPQTEEAIDHALAANVPIIVAVNKIDKPDAHPEKIRTEMAEHNITPEEWGGNIPFVDISAKSGEGLDLLLETILAIAEMQNLKANPNRYARGTVIESKMEKGRGPVATVLISRGTLHVGDIVVVGQQWGRVRSLQSDQGIQVESARPADPVEVIGLQGVPAAGDDLAVVENEAKAREISGYRQRKAREALAVKRIKGSSMEQILTIIKDGKMKELPVIIKGDVQGSVEALQGTLAKIANEEVRIKILHAAVGSINETDVSLARASQAIIIGFNVRANAQAREIAKRDNVDIRYYSIIYDVAHDMKKAVEGLLTPEEKEKILGYAEVRKVFNISKVGKVAGCMVTEGTIKRGAKVRLLRDHVVIHEGDLVQLKHAKDDLKEAKTGFECGIRIANYDDLKIGDQIECFEIEQIAPTLNIKV